MTTEYDELLARINNMGNDGDDLPGLLNDAQAAIRALTVQVVERDAVIEQAPHDGDICNRIVRDQYGRPVLRHGVCTCWKSQAPGDALAAHDKTVRATVLRDAAEYCSNGTWPERVYDWLRTRADQEEAQR